MTNEGLDCNYIANKIITKTNQNRTTEDLFLTCVRLNKLVLLCNIAHIQKHSKMLVNNSYFLWTKGLAIPKIYFDYHETGFNVFNRKVAKVEGKSQEDYEKQINPKLKRIVDKIVDRILEITRYVDTVDLCEILDPKIEEGVDVEIYHEEIIDMYKKFNFKRLEDLNEDCNWSKNKQ